MKRIGNLFEKIYDDNNIRAAIKISSRGKRNRPEVMAVLKDVDSHVSLVRELIRDGKYVPCKVRESVIREGSNNKERRITTINYFPDQVIHWCLMLVIKGYIQSSSYALSCGSMPDRGGHYGKKFVERWLRNNYADTRYCAKLDIHHFYPSIDHELMNQTLEHKFKDVRLLSLCRKIIDHYGEGLPIGFLTLQWFSNFFLQSLDYYIKQVLGIRYYVRYMDDMVLFGSNKRKLHRAVDRIRDFLARRKLKLKGNWQVFRTDSRPIDFLGFRFYRNKTTLRKNLMLRAARSAREVCHKYSPTERESRKLMSYLGWIRHADCYGMFLRVVKPCVDIHNAKLTISIADRRRSLRQKEKEL